MKLEKEVSICNYGFNEDNCGYDFLLLNPYYYFEENEKDFIIKNKDKKIKLTLEVEEPILTEKERKYLSGVVAPFRGNVCYIKKEEDHFGFQIIINHDDGDLYFPHFMEENEMYENMKLNKEYTLEELDL